jgi:hypothetical protein
MPGGGHPLVPTAIEGFPSNRGGQRNAFGLRIEVDGAQASAVTHSINTFKNRGSVLSKWNNQAEFYDCEWNNVRLLRKHRQ